MRRTCEACPDAAGQAIRRTPESGGAMSDKPKVCPRCEGKMVRGFIPDFAHAQIVVCTWVEGEPERSFWYGTKVPAERCMPTATFRYASCGYLETYASPEYGRK